MLPGETVLSGAKHPGTQLAVLKSAAGYFVGFQDTDGQPYSRESVYFADLQEALAFYNKIRN